MQPIAPGSPDPFDIILQEIPDDILEDVPLENCDVNRNSKRTYTYMEEEGDPIAKIRQTIEDSIPEVAPQLSRRKLSVTAPFPKTRILHSPLALRSRRNGPHETQLADRRSLEHPKRGKRAYEGSENNQNKAMPGTVNPAMILASPDEFSVLCKKGDFSRVKALLDAGFNIHIRNRNELDYLRSACAMGHFEIAQLLIERGADVDAASDSNGQTPLHLACAGEHLKIVRLLIECGADPNPINCIGNTPLYQACNCGFLRLAQLLIELGVDVNATGRGGLTPLLSACSHGHLKLAQLLLENGAHMSARSPFDGGTALHEACIRGRFEVARLLIEKGADLNAMDNSGKTPLYHVCSRNLEGALLFARLLLDHGADVNQTLNGNTPLHVACSIGFKDMARLLLENGADHELTNNVGNKPFQCAENPEEFKAAVMKTCKLD